MQQKRALPMPGTIIGYHKDLRPIFAIAGAEDGLPKTPEGQQPTSLVVDTPAQGKVFSEEDMNRARQEERDKLYPKMSKAEEQMAAMQAELAKIAQASEAVATEESLRAKAAEEAAKQQRESEMDAKTLIAEREKEWDNKLTDMQNQWAAKEAMWSKEQEFSRLANYTAQRITQEVENIAPELVQFVKGNTEQEIEASIATAIATTNAIVGKMQETIESQLANQQATAQRPLGVSPTGFTASGPLEVRSGTQSYTADDINAMTPAEFNEKIRKPRGMGNSQGKGLFD